MLSNQHDATCFHLFLFVDNEPISNLNSNDPSRNMIQMLLIVLKCKIEFKAHLKILKQWNYFYLEGQA